MLNECLSYDSKVPSGKRWLAKANIFKFTKRWAGYGEPIRDSTIHRTCLMDLGPLPIICLWSEGS